MPRLRDRYTLTPLDYGAPVISEYETDETEGQTFRRNSAALDARDAAPMSADTEGYS